MLLWVCVITLSLVPIFSESESESGKIIRENEHFKLFLKRDHFNPDQKALIPQEFMCHSKHFNTFEGVVLINLTIDPISSSNKQLPNLLYKLAVLVQGMVITLPIRFFGHSNLESQSFFSNLEYLTINQIIEDIYEFILVIRDELFLGIHPAAPIFLIGDHFLGSICIWARKAYPKRIQGCLASNPLLEAKGGFDELIVERNQRIDRIHSNCSESIKSANEYLEHLLNSKPIEVLNRQEDPEYDSMKFSTFSKLQILEAFHLYVNQMVERNEVKESCESLENSTITHLKFLQDMFSNFPSDLSFSPFFKTTFISEDSLKENKNISHTNRLWLWLQCTQFGLFITNPFENQLPRLLSLDYFKRKCSNVFGKENEHHFFDFESKNALYNTGFESTTNIFIVLQVNLLWTNALVSLRPKCPNIDFYFYFFYEKTAFLDYHLKDPNFRASSFLGTLEKKFKNWIDSYNYV